MSHPLRERSSPASPVGDIDAEGRLVDRTEEEREARSAALRAALADIEAIGPDGSDTPEIWEDLFRGIDSARPHRPLFMGRG